MADVVGQAHASVGDDVSLQGISVPFFEPKQGKNRNKYAHERKVLVRADGYPISGLETAGSVDFYQVVQSHESGTVNEGEEEGSGCENLLPEAHGGIALHEMFQSA